MPFTSLVVHLFSLRLAPNCLPSFFSNWHMTITSCLLALFLRLSCEKHMKVQPQAYLGEEDQRRPSSPLVRLAKVWSFASPILSIQLCSSGTQVLSKPVSRLIFSVANVIWVLLKLRLKSISGGGGGDEVAVTVTPSLVTTTTIAISPIHHCSPPPPPPSLFRSVFGGLRLHRSRDHHYLKPYSDPTTSENEAHSH
ncbi:hypothetical protein Bca52824_053701 [Brassica carinata]|uniref:Uncharacterized protein n=1 Tax=Brassica carinata TaxID=52824 RepID=A0A8X7ULZ5_BRACI|nr:hypothetical protein Bca52824_053701 [Brassica carinata]